MRRRTFLTTAGAAIASTGLVAGRREGPPEHAGQRGPPDHATDRHGTTLTGVFQESAGRIPGYTEWVGHRPAVVVSFAGAFSWAYPPKPWIQTWLGRPWKNGSVPLLTWEPHGEGNTAVQIAEGERDTEVTRWADAIAEWVFEGHPNRRLYFRPAHEMNGNWYPWSGDPEAYVRMWRYLYDTLAERGLDDHHIQWMWAVNNNDVGGIRAEEYYPGDEYVDWVGIDGYNFGDTREWSDWQSPGEIFGPMMGRLRDLTDKPLAFPEFATTSYANGKHRPEKKAEWIESVYSFITERNVKLASWFNIDKNGRDNAVYGSAYGTSTDEGTNVYEDYRRVLDGDEFVHAFEKHPQNLTYPRFTGKF